MAVKQIPNLPPAVFVSPNAQVEIVQDGTSYRASIGQIGGTTSGRFSVTNDVTSTTAYYPLYVRQSAGTPSVLYTSNPNYKYLPSAGLLMSQRLDSTEGIVYNSSQAALDYTFPIGDNGLSAGPLTVTATITVPPGSSWTVV